MLIPLLAQFGGTEEAALTDILPPENLAVYRYGSKYVELVWDAVDRTPDHGVKWYRLYIDGTWDGINIPAIYNSSTMNADKLTLTPGTAYAFKVTAVDSSDNETDFSNTVSITTPRNTDVGKFKKRRYYY